MRRKIAAKTDIFDFILMFYNRTRRHGSLDGICPEAFGARLIV